MFNSTIAFIRNKNKKYHFIDWVVCTFKLRHIKTWNFLRFWMAFFLEKINALRCSVHFDFRDINTYTIPLLYSIYHWKKAICSLLLRIKFRVLRDNYCSFEHSWFYILSKFKIISVTLLLLLLFILSFYSLSFYYYYYFIAIRQLNINHIAI